MKIRLLTPQDRELFESWLAKDEYHRQIGITWDDVVEEKTWAAVISDDDDVPLIIIRVHKALRVAMQFNPDRSYRTAKIARNVVKWIQEIAAEIEAKEVIIRPGGKAAPFADKLGFKDFVGKFIEVD